MNYIKSFIFLLTVALLQRKFVEPYKFITSVVNPCIYCNGEHIACNNTWTYNADCLPNANLINMTQPLKNLLMNYQNKYRNLIAGGGVAGFETAKRMATITWNPEMEYLSCLNVIRCRLEHDKCRQTPAYPYVGQNLGYMQWRGYNYTTEETVKALVDYWFTEYEYATMDDIRIYSRRSESLPLIGHFTLMVQEKANQMGCCILRQENTSSKINELYLGCNYSFTNFITIPVYRSGKPASACQTGSNPNYRNLCSESKLKRNSYMYIEKVK